MHLWSDRLKIILANITMRSFRNNNGIACVVDHEQCYHDFLTTISLKVTNYVQPLELLQSLPCLKTGQKLVKYTMELLHSFENEKEEHLLGCISNGCQTYWDDFQMSCIPYHSYNPRWLKAWSCIWLVIEISSTQTTIISDHRLARFTMQSFAVHKDSWRWWWEKQASGLYIYSSK